MDRPILMLIALFVFILLANIGCEQSESERNPKISVNVVETTDSVELKIYFEGLHVEDRGKYVLTLTEDQLGEYRRQLEFLLGRIDGAQQELERRASYKTTTAEE